MFTMTTLMLLFMDPAKNMIDAMWNSTAISDCEVTISGAMQGQIVFAEGEFVRAMKPESSPSTPRAKRGFATPRPLGLFFLAFCTLGVPETTYLFDNFCAMGSLEELCVECEPGGEANMSDNDMAGCIPSLAACKDMRKLELSGLILSTKRCAALSAVVPRMAALVELCLGENRINDDCIRVLAHGLSNCKQLQSLNLFLNMISDDSLDVLARGLPASVDTLHLGGNEISDDGLDVLIQGLPTSVDTLDLKVNEITLARNLLLLRFKRLDLSDNTLCPDGPRVIAASLANPECRLELLNLRSANIGDEGAAILAEGLRDNQRLIRMLLRDNNITKEGWNAFSSTLCDI